MTRYSGHRIRDWLPDASRQFWPYYAALALAAGLLIGTAVAWCLGLPL